MPIIKWEPFDEVDDLLEGRPYISMFPKLGWDFAIDLYEESGSIIARMNLPGVNPEELELSIDEDSLSVSGSREEEEETEKRDYYSKEIRRGSFARSVSLPRSVDAAKTVAEYADGILTITMPTREGVKKNPIQVKVVKR